MKTFYNETIAHKGFKWRSDVTIDGDDVVFHATYFAPIYAGDDVIWDHKTYHVIEIRPDDGALARLV